MPEDLYARALARLAATPFPMSDDTRREYEDMQKLIRALLVERHGWYCAEPSWLSTRLRQEIADEALREFGATDEDLREFAGGTE